MAPGMSAVRDVSLRAFETQEIASSPSGDSYGKHSQPSGSEIPRQGRSCYAVGRAAKSGPSLRWKEIGAGASVGVRVNTRLGVCCEKRGKKPVLRLTPNTQEK